MAERVEPVCEVQPTNPIGVLRVLLAGMDEHDLSGAKMLIRYFFRKGMDWYRHRDWATVEASEETLEPIGGKNAIQNAKHVVERMFLERDDEGGTRGEIEHPHILLAPPLDVDRSIVCLLGVRWMLSEQFWEMSLYLHMFGRSANTAGAFWHRGYRLEMPHPGGNHNYTHVQPVHSLGYRRRKPIPFSDQSLPERFPTIPVVGTTLTTMCATLGVSLYGRRELKRMADSLRSHAYEGDVKRLLRRL